MKNHRVLFFAWILVGVLATGFASYSISRPEVYLKTGNIIRFTWIYDSGARRTAATEINSVTTNHGVTTIIAKSKVYDDAGKVAMTYNYRFYCDSLNWCVDALNWMNVSDLPAGGQNYTYESDSLMYPLNMKSGDTLLPARGVKSAGGKGSSSVESQFTYNRKVIKQDTIKTQMGEMVAFRIEAKVAARTKMEFGNLGSSNDEDIMTVKEWFHPQYGVVMSERTGKYGTTKTVLQAVK